MNCDSVPRLRQRESTGGPRRTRPGHLPERRGKSILTLLPQETLILNGTIREDIACGRPGAGDTEIEQAARAAAAHDFVTVLPDGYDTHIAPGTAALSGGQLKRITITRAMLRAPPSWCIDGGPYDGTDHP